MSSDDVLLTGATGELIERFCQVLQRLGEHNAEWAQLPLVGLAVDIRARVDYRNVDPSHDQRSLQLGH